MDTYAPRPFGGTEGDQPSRVTRSFRPNRTPERRPSRGFLVSSVVRTAVSSPSHRCDGCGALLESVTELDRQSGTTGRSWACTYCGTSVPSVVGEKLSHHRDESATDRRS